MGAVSHFFYLLPAPCGFMFRPASGQSDWEPLPISGMQSIRFWMHVNRNRRKKSDLFSPEISRQRSQRCQRVSWRLCNNRPRKSNRSKTHTLTNPHTHIHPMSNHNRPWRDQQRELRRQARRNKSLTPQDQPRAGAEAPTCPNHSCGIGCLCLEKRREQIA